MRQPFLFHIAKAVTKKHTASIAASGVMAIFSFLLDEIRFKNVLSTKNPAKQKQIIFVTPLENHMFMCPPP